MAEDRSILFVDAYDSFSENIKALLSEALSANVTTIKIDTNVQEELHVSIDQFVCAFDAIVLGPGPGDPRNGSGDTGIFNDIFDHATTNHVPVLGICLGFQMICLRYGLSVQRLSEPCHGHAKQILPTKSHSLFEDINKDCIYATCYNSLGVPVSASPQHADNTRPSSPSSNTSFESSSDLSEKLTTSFSTGFGLQILAVDEDDYVMAAAHSSLPHHGFQFHPESCKSNASCSRLLQNWFRLVETHNALTKRDQRTYRVLDTYRERELHLKNADISCGNRESTSGSALSCDEGFLSRRHIFQRFAETTRSSSPRVMYRQKKTHLNLQAVSKRLQDICNNNNMAMLESTKKGRFSVYALIDESSVFGSDVTNPIKEANGLVFAFRNGVLSINQPEVLRSNVKKEENKFHTAEEYPRASAAKIRAKHNDVLGAIEDLMVHKQATGGPPEVPFWGGFIGFMSYELGLKQLGVQLEEDEDNSVDDINLMWADRSVIFDSLTHTITIQSLRPKDEMFIENSFRTFEHGLSITKSITEDKANDRLHQALRMATIQLPDHADYDKNYDCCQNNLRAGNSYELCLTTEAKVSLPNLSSDLIYQLYRNLHAHNPVPYGAFFDSPTITVLSSSPEEFMSWDRSGTIDMRPMKGTVRRSPSMTLDRATRILSTPKESAENLMIADLIRHDLYSAVGYMSKVEIVKLCEVIEHETVYQLVSHIQATAPIPKIMKDPFRRQLSMKYGFSALTKSLPPGSMTGAPKKRSCEILRSLEKRDRGLYSGVLGYLDVGGGGAWNVCIRTAFKVKDSANTSTQWRIGAGGAITVLSNRRGEWEEMQTKLSSVLKGFTTVKQET